jgi:hypothetical protein
MQWSRDPGFYEVWYLTLTDRETGTGLWIRYTLLAPNATAGEEPTCALWFLAMEPGAAPYGRKVTFPIAELSSRTEPFELRIGDAALTDRGARGTAEDASWELEWEPSPHGYEYVHPLLRRARLAKTVLTLPQPDVGVSGRVRFGERTLELDGTRGGQAHLWGTKHAGSWAWVHCNDFETLDGEPRPGVVVDGVSVIVPRLGREIGPSTPVVARVDGRDFASISPRRVVTNASRFALTGWSFTADDGGRRLVGEVDAPRESLAGVTYHDPDGERAYCFNTEIATLRLQVREGDKLLETFVAPGRAHFEYAQREPVPGVPLLTE